MEEPLSTYAMFILGSIFSMYFFFVVVVTTTTTIIMVGCIHKVGGLSILNNIIPFTHLKLTKKKSKVKVRGGGEKEREKKKEEGREKKDNHTTKTKKKLVPVCIWCRYGIQTVYYVKQLVFINISTISFYNCIYHFIHPI